MTPTSLPVAVIGGGPVGLAAAAHLLERGLEPVVLEAGDAPAAAVGAAAVLYAASLGMWIIAAKPIQFYYHYALPGLFLLGALALALDDLRRAGWRRTSGWTLAASVALFVLFFPILSALPLPTKGAFALWTWLPGWR